MIGAVDKIRTRVDNLEDGVESLHIHLEYIMEYINKRLF